MKLVYGPAEQIRFSVDTKSGHFHWNSSRGPRANLVLTVEDSIPHWGVVRSIEAKVLRDGCVAEDMQVSNIGITEKALDGKNVIDLQFEVQHFGKEDVTQHTYAVVATVEFVGINAPQKD
jgi:hypothetical protein